MDRQKAKRPYEKENCADDDLLVRLATKVYEKILRGTPVPEYLHYCWIGRRTKSHYIVGPKACWQCVITHPEQKHRTLPSTIGRSNTSLQAKSEHSEVYKRLQMAFLLVSKTIYEEASLMLFSRNTIVLPT